MSPITCQLTTPMADPRRPTLVEVAVHPHAGRLYRCARCGAEVWSAWGHARRHRRYCRRQDWPGGRP